MVQISPAREQIGVCTGSTQAGILSTDTSCITTPRHREWPRMRYAKGSVVISVDADIPLLRQVRNSRFVSHEQLFELLNYETVVSCRSTFNWRIQRLLNTHRVKRLDDFFVHGCPVYSITNEGLLELENQGDFAIALHSRSRHMPDPAQLFHCLELNSIRLALARNALLIEWMSEVEIASRNMVSVSPWQKDYDAIVKIWVGNEIREFALEYERSLKNAKQYAKIRAALEAEQQIPCVLYLTTSQDLLTALICHLTPSSKAIAFALKQPFMERLLETSVTAGGDEAAVSLSDFLRYAHPLYIHSFIKV